MMSSCHFSHVVCTARQGLCKLGAHVLAIDASEHNILVAEVLFAAAPLPFLKDITVDETRLGRGMQL